MEGAGHEEKPAVGGLKKTVHKRPGRELKSPRPTRPKGTTTPPAWAPNNGTGH